MSNRLSEATEMLLKMEEFNDEQSIEVSKLQLQNTKLLQQLEDKNNIIEEHKVSFEIQMNQHKTEINEVCIISPNFLIKSIVEYIFIIPIFAADERTIVQVKRRF